MLLYVPRSFELKTYSVTMSLIPLKPKGRGVDYEYRLVKNYDESLFDTDNSETESEYLLLKRSVVNRYGEPSPVDNQPVVRNPLIVSLPIDHELAELIYCVLNRKHVASQEQPKTSPKMPPVKRGKRHRNYFVWQMNQFVSKNEVCFGNAVKIIEFN
jgi:hypothetical protein